MPGCLSCLASLRCLQPDLFDHHPIGSKPTTSATDTEKLLTQAAALGRVSNLNPGTVTASANGRGYAFSVLNAGGVVEVVGEGEEGGGGPEDEAGVADGEQAGGGGAADLADADGGAPGGHHDGSMLFEARETARVSGSAAVDVSKLNLFHYH